MSQPSKHVPGRIKFLVCVDGRPHSRVAVRFACHRAKNTGGRVALLHVLAPAEFQHWQAVGDLMQDERREEAERLLQDLAAEVNASAGVMPELFVRSGGIGEEILALIEEDPTIDVVVVGAAPASEGRGWLVSWLAGQLAGRLRIPLTVVPGNLTDEQIIDLT
ncbi:MAG: universal stress protein [Alphaproteobacteria bacterium]